MRASTITCVLAREWMTYAMVGGSAEVPLAGHVESCLRCQAYRAEINRRRRQLAELGDRVEAPPIDLVDSVFLDLDRPQSVPTAWVPWAGAVVALSVVVWFARRHMAA